MHLRNLDDVRDLFSKQKTTFIGVGMTAYSRLTPSYFVHPYHTIALRKTRDLTLLRERSEVFCLEEEVGELIRESGFNAAKLLSRPSVTEWLRGLPNPKNLLVYQSYPPLETIAEREGWGVLANSAALRLRIATRTFFEKMVADLGLRRIPGAIHPVEEIASRRYDDWAEMVGTEFVVQLPDIVQGNGRGTFFVSNSDDYSKLQERLSHKRWRGVALKSVSVRRFMHGVPASTALCVTRHGVLTSGLQRQILDLDYCGDIAENGVFCGHSWQPKPWPPDLQAEAGRQGRRIGEYLAALGYRGVLGIDFIVDEQRRRVYPVEINPRFTGAFPMLSLLHLKKRLIPFEAFHMLELMDLTYHIDVDLLNEAYAEPLQGSHLILYLPRAGKEIVIDNLEAGLYQLDEGRTRASFVRGVLDYRDIAGSNQFAVVDGPPNIDEATVFPSEPMYRLCRVLFSYPVLDPNGALLPRAQRAVDWIYDRVIPSAL